MEKKFPSKIGFLIVIPISFLILMPIVLIYKNSFFWPPVLLSFVAFAFMGHLLLSTHYIVKDRNLKIKSGFIYNLNIQISTIRKINESNSVLSAPASSLDRLEIIYNKYDSVLISPKEKTEFIKTMLEINPTIEVNYKKQSFLATELC